MARDWKRFSRRIFRITFVPLLGMLGVLVLVGISAFDASNGLFAAPGQATIYLIYFSVAVGSLTAVVGAPVYWALGRLGWHSWWSLLFAGTLMGWLLGFTMNILLYQLALILVDIASSDSHYPIEPASDGPSIFSEMPILGALSGALAAFLYWVVAYRRWRSDTRAPEASEPVSGEG